MTTDSSVLLAVEDLKVHFPIRRGLLQRQVGVVRAVDGISFEVRRGKTLGLVGESGCGKSTTGRAILRVHQPTAGRVMLEDVDLALLDERALRKVRPRIQMIFQDPYDSLDPRKTAERIVAEPLEIHNLARGAERRQRVHHLLEVVGLSSKIAQRYPHEFSGGQRQRIGIARALALNPSFIVCDEPISALDVSIQAQVVNLLRDLQEEFGLTYLFIAHDLNMVQYLSEQIAVMYLGKLAELADREALYHNPLHPYTRALLSAVPVPDPLVEEKSQRVILAGEIPDPANPPRGCSFNTRCPLAEARCFVETPEWRQAEPDHWVACHLV